MVHWLCVGFFSVTCFFFALTRESLFESVWLKHDRSDGTQAVGLW